MLQVAIGARFTPPSSKKKCFFFATYILMSQFSCVIQLTLYFHHKCHSFENKINFIHRFWIQFSFSHDAWFCIGYLPFTKTMTIWHSNTYTHRHKQTKYSGFLSVVITLNVFLLINCYQTIWNCKHFINWCVFFIPSARTSSCIQEAARPSARFHIQKNEWKKFADSI